MSVIIYNKNEQEIVRVKGNDEEEKRETYQKIEDIIRSGKKLDSVIIGRKVNTQSSKSKEKIKSLSTQHDFEIRSVDKLIKESYFLIKRPIKENNYREVLTKIYSLVEKIKKEMHNLNR